MSYHRTVPPLQGLPFPVGPPIQRTLGSLPNHRGVSRPPPNHSRLLCRPLKPHQGLQGAPNHTKVILTHQGTPFSEDPPHLVPRPLPYHFLPHQGPPPPVISQTLSSSRMLHQGGSFSTLLQAAPPSPTRATPLGSKGEAFLSALQSGSSFSPLPWILPPPSLPIFLSGPFLQLLLHTRVNPQLCPFLEVPQSQIRQISQSSPLPEYLPHQTPLPTGLLPCQSFLPCQALPLHDPSSLLELPHKTISAPGPSHNRTLSPSLHPIPGSGLARPRGAGARWGPQLGGRAASMAVVAVVSRQPPVPARPARQAPRRGGQAGQAARWVTTAGSSRRRQGRGEKETRVSPGHAGEGESRWTGEGRVNPRPAGPAQRSHPPQGTPASRPPPWRPAPARGAQAGGAGPNLAVHTYHGNNRAIGRCCQEINQSQRRTAVARRRRCGRRSRAQTKGGSEAPLPPPKTAPSGSAPSRNPTMNSQARPAPARRPPSLLLRPRAKSRGDAGRAGPRLPSLPENACCPPGAASLPEGAGKGTQAAREARAQSCPQAEDIRRAQRARAPITQ